MDPEDMLSEKQLAQANTVPRGSGAGTAKEEKPCGSTWGTRGKTDDSCVKEALSLS